MMKTFLFKMKSLQFMLALFALPYLTSGQTGEINDHVWRPFIQAQQEINEEMYLGIHSSDMIRCERANKKVYGFDVYKEEIRKGFQRAQQAKSEGKGIELKVELRFLERISSENEAYEVGYYKSIIKLLSGEKRTYYSEFHVALKKQEGHWKIVSDSSLPRPDLTEEVFQSASPM